MGKDYVNIVSVNKHSGKLKVVGKKRTGVYVLFRECPKLHSTIGLASLQYPYSTLGSLQVPVLFIDIKGG